jgi:hypothetical protein
MKIFLYIILGVTIGLSLGLYVGFIYSQSKHDDALKMGEINGCIKMTKWLGKYFLINRSQGLISNSKLVESMNVKDATINVVDIDGNRTIRIVW